MTPVETPAVTGGPRLREARAWLGVALVALAVAGLAFVALAPRVLDWRFVVISGGSMEPSIHIGSAAVMDHGAADDVRPGDIIMFHDPAEPARVVTHRVVAVSPDGRTLTTQGDANQTPDATPVPASAVVARYKFAVPYAGYVVHWVGTPRGYLSLILIPGIAIVTLEVRSIVVTLLGARRRKGASA